MAVRHGYGKIAGTDALVFAYDTGDTRNSYRGEPTTNIVTNPTFLGTPNTQTSAIADNWYFSGDTSATGFRFYDSATSPITLKFPNEGAVITTGPNATSNRRIYYNGTVEPNTTYTLSYWLYTSAYAGISNYFFVYQANGTDAGSTSYGQGVTTGQWVFVQQSFTTPSITSNQRSVNWGPVISAGTDSLFAMQRFQIEAKSHATPFVNGTRSATEGLKDLTGNRSIDLSNVSFDGNAHPDWDATNDYIALESDWVVKTSGGWTVESVVKYDAVAGGYDNLISPANFIGSDTISYNSWYWSVLSNKLALWNISPGIWKYGSTTILPNKWYHVTLVSYDNGTQYQMYLNGVAEGGDHTTYSWNASYSGLRVRYFGAGQSTRRYVNGTIPITKIYNRALTAAEVANNYNHYKGRFNI